MTGDPPNDQQPLGGDGNPPAPIPDATPAPGHGRSGDGLDSVIPAMQEQERQRQLDKQ